MAGTLFGLFLKDKKVYKGNYVNDKKEGYGEFFWPGMLLI